MKVVGSHLSIVSWRQVAHQSPLSGRRHVAHGDSHGLKIRGNIPSPVRGDIGAFVAAKGPDAAPDGAVWETHGCHSIPTAYWRRGLRDVAATRLGNARNVRGQRCWPQGRTPFGPT